MKKLNLWSIILLVGILFAFCAFTALAATSNPSPASTGYTPLVIPVMGNYSTTQTGIIKFTAPAGYSIVTASANAKASSGTSPTLKVLLKSGAYTNYSGSVAAAGTVKVLTAGSTTKIADESAVAVDMVIGGTSPRWRDLTLFILLKRL